MKHSHWWQQAVIYEIFPKAFSDDGFKGIQNKLPYLQSLGIDTIWLCPIFMSPFKDSGYDISDYYKVNPMFGDMEAFKALVAETHKLGLKVILDIALNHTSHQHPWFLSAVSSKDSPYRDYYIFEDGQGPDTPPNNWVSSKTRKSTWTYNEATNDYYLHIYTKYQPDLNWSNPKVRRVCGDILLYWLKLGVDGFRLDVINKIAKPDQMLMDCDDIYADGLYENHPKSHDYIHELNQYVKDQYPECFLLGQISGVTTKQANQYARPDNQALDSFLQFEHMDINRLMETHLRAWHLSEFKDIMMKWQQLDDGVIGTTFLANHDSSRAVNHFTDATGEDVEKGAKMLCMLQLSLKGIPVIYMGDELGMTNIHFKSIEDFSDIRSHDIYENLLGSGMEADAIIEILNQISRDNARQQPMFATKDSSEVTAFYRFMIQFRKAHDILMSGKTRPVEMGPKVVAFDRYHKSACIRVMCNFSNEAIPIDDMTDHTCIKTTSKHFCDTELAPYEGRMYRING